ncbi:Putative nucleoside phosphorylase domain, NACHT nucleoside triphosphatase [Colletotrichum destructivum]|uniref:protein S-acyltransferase n=1 Tax=Colletotrichum destructivum TaxID=34406 RepID=A0AAX4I8A0_9PEZI|nr:Putative nucleoside phosphorylase domain, NACHT nucleoside triphosphatase [Colletotrichum destructivum]
MLDRTHESLPPKENDDNTYTLGNIGRHNIVMACLPLGQYGTNNAAIVASNMHRSFPSIRIRLMVGIGGGVPGHVDIRLGDIVVGNRVIQYDMGKMLSGGRIQRTGVPREPPSALLKAIAQLQAHHERTASQVPAILAKVFERYPSLSRFAYPIALEDRLFRATYEHGQQPDCHHCDLSELQGRPERTSRDPKVYHGGIASGNQVVKSAKDRDALAQELGIICFEMEAAGLMDIFPCLVIRGICDYADSHKNKQWQPYAAATAAAFAKELLSVIATSAAAMTPAVVQDSRATETPTPTPTPHDKHGSYKDWLDPSKAAQHRGFLWIRGKPGAGKSTLMKFAYGNVRRRSEANTCHISFFFNARGDELEKSTVGLHRSLLLQVMERVPDLQSVLDDPVLIPQQQSVCPSTEVLRELFRNAVMGLGQRRLVCFVDALDECDEEQVREMVTYFEDLGDEATNDGIQLQICFSSRHYPHIEIENGLRLTLEDQPGHEKDLEKYVRSCLRVGKRSDAEEIKNGVLKKANGVFMWVVLVVDILNKEYARGRISAARRKLDEIPSRLSELFKDIVRRDNEHMEDLLLCIQWILYAKRPLTREEFYFGMLCRSPEDLSAFDPERITNSDLDLAVVSSSKGLAEITKSKVGTVQFIHESVRDFLIKDNGLQDIWPEIGEKFQSTGHEKLKQCCHAYINFGTTNHIDITESLPKANSPGAKELRQRISKELPFAEYAAEHVLYHANAAATEIPQNDFLEGFSLREWIHLNNVLEKHEIRRYTPNANLVYILAEKNLIQLVETYVRDHPNNIHVMGERYQFPMFAALSNGYLLAAKALFGQTAKSYRHEDLFSSIYSTKNLVIRKNQTPLLWAIENRLVALATIMAADTNTDPSLVDEYRRTALHLASILGDDAAAVVLVESLIDLHAKRLNKALASTTMDTAQASQPITAKASVDMFTFINRKDSSGGSPLSLAASGGFDHVVQKLVDKGASIDTRDITSQTPFYLAAYAGHATVVRILLENGAPVDDLDRNGNTALHDAAGGGHTAVATVLLDYGASVSKTNYDGMTPIHLAATRGHEAVVKNLLEHGAPVDDLDRNGNTALHDAAGGGHTAVATVLLDYGASVNKINCNGMTPLHLAATRGHEAVVKNLLEHGAPVDDVNCNGETALHYAAWYSRTAVATILLEYGASVNKINCNGTTPLHLAAYEAYEAVVKTLLEHGAPVDDVNRNGETALHNAVRYGHTAVVATLLENGARSNKGVGLVGRTPLHLAVKYGKVGAVKLLLKHGASIHDKDRNGQTPLSLAIARGDQAVAKMLEENHTNIEGPK